MSKPALPPFPEKPSPRATAGGALFYYHDLAAAWEARARLMHALTEDIASGEFGINITIREARRLIGIVGQLPPKE